HRSAEPDHDARPRARFEAGRFGPGGEHAGPGRRPPTIPALPDLLPAHSCLLVPEPKRAGSIATAEQGMFLRHHAAVVLLGSARRLAVPGFRLAQRQRGKLLQVRGDALRRLVPGLGIPRITEYQDADL